MNIRATSFALLALAGLLPTAIVVKTETMYAAVVRPAIQPQALNPQEQDLATLQVKAEQGDTSAQKKLGGTTSAKRIMRTA